MTQTRHFGRIPKWLSVDGDVLFEGIDRQRSAILAIWVNPGGCNGSFARLSFRGQKDYEVSMINCVENTGGSN
jgi:hypothetical protein